MKLITNRNRHTYRWSTHLRHTRRRDKRHLESYEWTLDTERHTLHDTWDRTGGPRQQPEWGPKPSAKYRHWCHRAGFPLVRSDVTARSLLAAGGHALPGRRAPVNPREGGAANPLSCHHFVISPSAIGPFVDKMPLSCRAPAGLGRPISRTLPALLFNLVF